MHHWQLKNFRCMCRSFCMTMSQVIGRSLGETSSINLLTAFKDTLILRRFAFMYIVKKEFKHLKFQRFQLFFEIQL